MKASFPALLSDIQHCRICQNHLPHVPRPVVAVSTESKIIVTGQAPGSRVHESGIPWNDASGKNLRRWLGVTDEQFYDTRIFGIIPMGFCYPGKGRSGDLPPRPECAPQWHQVLLQQMPAVKITLLIGQYAQSYYLGHKKKETLTQTVRSYRQYLPVFFPLVHPSPRNGIWLGKNRWFEDEVIPELQRTIRQIIDGVV